MRIEEGAKRRSGEEGKEERRTVRVEIRVGCKLEEHVAEKEGVADWERGRGAATKGDCESLFFFLRGRGRESGLEPELENWLKVSIRRWSSCRKETMS